jgi:hypothetical protein
VSGLPRPDFAAPAVTTCDTNLAPHPGQISLSGLADAIGVSRQPVNEFVRERRAVSRDVADLIDDHGRNPAQALEFLVQAAGTFGGTETVDPGLRGGEGNSMAAPGGSNSEQRSCVDS